MTETQYTRIMNRLFLAASTVFGDEVVDLEDVGNIILDECGIVPEYGDHIMVDADQLTQAKALLVDNLCDLVRQVSEDPRFFEQVQRDGKIDIGYRVTFPMLREEE